MKNEFVGGPFILQEEEKRVYSSRRREKRKVTCDIATHLKTLNPNF